MDFSTSATVLLCTHNPALAERWIDIEGEALAVVSTGDSQVALERVLLDPQVWLVVIDSQWEVSAAQRFLSWLQRSVGPRLGGLPVLILAESLASSEWAPLLAEPVHAVLRSSGAERLVRQLFDQASASGRQLTEVTVEWQGAGRPLLPRSLAADGPSAAPAMIRATDRWQQRSPTQWTLQLDGDQVDVLAPLLRLSGHLRGAAQDKSEAPAASATGCFVAHLHGTTYRLPVNAG